MMMKTLATLAVTLFVSGQVLANEYKKPTTGSSAPTDTTVTAPVDQSSELNTESSTTTSPAGDTVTTEKKTEVEKKAKR